MPTLTFDIETLPAPPETLDAILADIRAAGPKIPGSVKKAETISEYTAAWERELPALAQEQYRKTSLRATDGGRLLCVGYVWDPKDGSPISQCECGVLGFDNDARQFQLDEARTISEWWALVDRVEHINPRTEVRMDGLSNAIRYVGHNVLGFDLGFLDTVSIRHGVVPTREFSQKSSGTWPVYDTMPNWPECGYKDFISLDKLCHVCGIPSPKTDMDGSKVWDAYQAGRHEDLYRYALADVYCTRVLYLKETHQPEDAERAIAEIMDGRAA